MKFATKRAPRLPEIDIDPAIEYREPIGEIVMRWTRVEYQLGVLIRVIRQQSKAQQREELYNQRTSALCRMARDEVAKVGSRDRQVADDLVQFVRRAKKYGKRRDGYVHSLYGNWAGDRAKLLRFRMKQTTNAEVLHDGASTAELAAFAADIRTLQIEAQALTTRLKRIFGTRR